MIVGKVLRFFGLAVLLSAVGAGASESDAESAPLSFVPVMVLKYVDPATGNEVECGPGCRRLNVPEGVDLEVSIRVENGDGTVTGQGLVWDLWFNQPLHPYPGVRLEDCRGGDNGDIDIECWRDMYQRVEWADWEDLTSDRLCVPTANRSCRDETFRVALDPDFEGARRSGTYHFALWLDRFRSSADENEFDNFVGPVRVTVVPKSGGEGEPKEPIDPRADDSAEIAGAEVVEPAAPKPWNLIVVPKALEGPFFLSSDRSRGILQFEPAIPGLVEIEVETVGNPQVLVVEVRKISTGEVLAGIRDRGRLTLSGTIGPGLLKNDRGFEVVVRSAARPQGLRGLIRVSYPDRAIYQLSD